MRLLLKIAKHRIFTVLQKRCKLYNCFIINVLYLSYLISVCNFYGAKIGGIIETEYPPLGVFYPCKTKKSHNRQIFR
jgi:hypothetical protein